MRQEIIEKMMAIPWRDRRIVVGDARDIPQALLELTSPDSDVRKRAYWSIDNHVVVQSDLYDAAYDVIPFLIELAREKCPHGRDYVYDLLIEIAGGHAADDLACEIEPGERLPLRAACRRALLAGIDTFRRDLSDADLSIRSQVTCMLELMDEPI